MNTSDSDGEVLYRDTSSQSDSTGSTARPVPSTDETSRTGIDILWCLSVGPARPPEIQAELARYYGREVPDDRIYDGLDKLEEDGLVYETDPDGVFRVPALTDRGQRLLARRELWIHDLRHRSEL